MKWQEIESLAKGEGFFPTYFMISFFQWLEINDLGGEVHAAKMSNVAADDGFKRIRSKWMAGHLPQRRREFDPEKKFGKKKRYSKSK